MRLYIMVDGFHFVYSEPMYSKMPSLIVRYSGKKWFAL